MFSLPARIVDITDAQALEWQLVENSQRVDVHPYEEAQGFECLLDMPGHDVAALVEKSGKSAAHVYARLSLLQLIRPSGERRYTLLDDLDRAKLAMIIEHGFEPCAVIETSPGNYQAWLRHTRILSKTLGTLAAQTLARRFGADPGAADWRRFGRLPGFTNRKPQHRTAAGLFPFVQLHHGGQQFTSAESFERQLVSLQKSSELERKVHRQRSTPWTARSARLQVSLFRAFPRYQGRPAAADMAFSIAACAAGWSQGEIADALACDYLSRDPSISKRAAYLRRTTEKAMLWIKG